MIIGEENFWEEIYYRGGIIWMDDLDLFVCFELLEVGVDLGYDVWLR